MGFASLYASYTRKIPFILLHSNRSTGNAPRQGQRKKHHPSEDRSQTRSGLGHGVGVDVPIGQGLGEKLEYADTDGGDQQGHGQPSDAE